MFLAVVRDRPGLVRTTAALYLAAIVACYLIPNPVGSNIARLGVLAACPILLARTSAPRSLLARATLAAMIAWQLFGPITETAKSFATPSRTSIYAPLLDQLAVVGADSGRIEIVPTATRWEVARVGQRFALARGWESQLDRQRKPPFYGAAPLDSADLRSLARRQRRPFRGPAVDAARALEPRGGAARRRAASRTSGRFWQEGPWTLFAVAGAPSLTRGPAVGRAAHARHRVLVGDRRGRRPGPRPLHPTLA